MEFSKNIPKEISETTVKVEMDLNNHDFKERSKEKGYDVSALNLDEASDSMRYDPSTGIMRPRRRRSHTKKKKFTTIRIPNELMDVVYQVVECEGVPLFLVENRAVEKFLNDNATVSHRYQHRKYDESYIKRDKVLPLILTEELTERVEQYKKKTGVYKSSIVLQALENDCVMRLEKLGIPVRISYLKNDEQ